MEMWQVWLLVKLDSITGFLMFIAPMSVMLAGVGLGIKHGVFFDNPEEFPKPCSMLIRNVCIVALVSVPLAVLTPTTKEASVIIAVPAIMESRVVKEDIPEVYDLAVEWAKEKLGKPVNVEAP